MNLPNKLDYETFVKRAVLALRTEKSKGIHVLFSGFSKAFKDHYGEGVDQRNVVDRLVAKGVIVTRPARKGIMIYLATDAPVMPVNSLDKILSFADTPDTTSESHIAEESTDPLDEELEAS